MLLLQEACPHGFEAARRGTAQPSNGRTKGALFASKTNAIAQSVKRLAHNLQEESPNPAGGLKSFYMVGFYI